MSRDGAPRALLAALVAFVFTIAALAGCGGGDDDDDDDDAPAADAAPGGGGDQPDAFPGGGVGDQPDAAPGSGGGGSPFFRLTCSPDPTPGDGDADAGPPEEQTCCDPTGVCPAGFECLTGAGADDPHRCSPRCDDQGACAAGAACADFGGVAVCIPAAREGEACAPELCDASGICVGASADDATCHRRCLDTSECEAPQTCQQLVGSPNRACI